ncbi:hypothetical protein MN608_00617 [Microdochium nivale]|nr:hypothetical protein MN608_00617 [Microdochium nivale]
MSRMVVVVKEEARIHEYHASSNLICWLRSEIETQYRRPECLYDHLQLQGRGKHHELPRAQQATARQIQDPSRKDSCSPISRCEYIRLNFDLHDTMPRLLAWDRPRCLKCSSRKAKRIFRSDVKLFTPVLVGLLLAWTCLWCSITFMATELSHRGQNRYFAPAVIWFSTSLTSCIVLTSTLSCLISRREVKNAGDRRNCSEEAGSGVVLETTQGLVRVTDDSYSGTNRDISGFGSVQGSAVFTEAACVGTENHGQSHIGSGMVNHHAPRPVQLMGSGRVAATAATRYYKGEELHQTPGPNISVREISLTNKDGGLDVPTKLLEHIRQARKPSVSHGPVVHTRPKNCQNNAGEDPACFHYDVHDQRAASKPANGPKISPHSVHLDTRKLNGSTPVPPTSRTHANEAHMNITRNVNYYSTMQDSELRSFSNENSLSAPPSRRSVSSMARSSTSISNPFDLYTMDHVSAEDICNFVSDESSVRLGAQHSRGRSLTFVNGRSRRLAHGTHSSHSLA